MWMRDTFGPGFVGFVRIVCLASRVSARAPARLPGALRCWCEFYTAVGVNFMCEPRATYFPALGLRECTSQKAPPRYHGSRGVNIVEAFVDSRTC
eukprot:240219-Prymnesium_polylepis.1